MHVPFWSTVLHKGSRTHLCSPGHNLLKKQNKYRTTMTTSFMPQTQSSAPVHAAKGNKKRTTKGGKKKEAAENAPIFLRSKFCIIPMYMDGSWLNGTGIYDADRPFKQIKNTRLSHNDDTRPWRIVRLEFMLVISSLSLLCIQRRAQYLLCPRTRTTPTTKNSRLSIYPFAETYHMIDTCDSSIATW